MQNQRGQAPPQNIRPNIAQSPQNASSPFAQPIAGSPQHSSPHAAVASVLPADSNGPLTEYSADGASRPPQFSHSLDPASAAKQMSALDAMARSRGLGGQPQMMNGVAGTPPNGMVLTPSQPGAPLGGQYQGFQPQLAGAAGIRPPNVPGANINPLANASVDAGKKQGLLRMLAEYMQRSGTPLPPALTGVPAPTYDPSSSKFNIIETTAEPGIFRLAGKDVDLIDLFMMVSKFGGFAKVG